ncbi:hypothetical protein [Chitinivorax sp. B]|uniref:hypothetical protein n=1 Tax=Chitinivorax sp. B TaxID=2502235 RepID=UPI0010FA3FF7|nr:hypothetical protein [Chitinivorax sp. B]
MAIGKISPTLTELNYDMVWNKMSNDVKGAFIGTPQKVKLPAGFRLYKFTEFYIANRQGKVTEWWSPVNPYDMDPGLAARISLAKHLGANPSDLTRVMAAVKENWNALTFVLQAELQKPVYAFWGQCAMQRRRDANSQTRAGIPPAQARTDMPMVKTINLPGYAWQFYCPALTPAHIREISRNPVGT